MKQKLLSLIFTLTGSMSLCAPTTQGQEIATWSDWCSSAVTFSFWNAADRHVSHEWAVEKLDHYGYKGTFAIVTNWSTNYWDTYKGYAQNGHEMGSQSDNYGSPASSSELSSSKNTIETNIGQPCLTIAYPNGIHMGNTVSDYYISGLIYSGYNQINPSSPSDMTKVDGIMTGSNGLNTQDALTSKCENAKNSNGWVVFIIIGFDGIDNGFFSPLNQSAFTGTLNWLDNNKSTYWVGTMRDVAMYIKERDNATFKKTAQDASTITYSLTLELDKTLCNWDYPLSLRVPMPNEWPKVTVSQKGMILDSYIKDGMVYFKAIPNGGNIVLSQNNDIESNPTISDIPAGWKVNDKIPSEGKVSVTKGAKVVVIPANIPAGKKIKSIKLVPTE